MKMRFVGDILLANSAFDHGFGYNDYYRKQTLTLPFNLKDGINTKDIGIGNLEFVISSTLYDNYSHKKQLKSHLADSSIASVLSQSGVDLVSVANNHILQHGTNSFYETLDNLKSNKIDFFGTFERPFKTLYINNREVGVFSASLKYDPHYQNEDTYYYAFPVLHLNSKQYSELYEHLTNIEREFLAQYISHAHSNNYHQLFPSIKNEILYMNIATRAIRENIWSYYFIKDLKEFIKNHDYTILYLHWGHEYVHYPAPWQQQLAEFFVEIGIDSIIGNHAHAIQGLEKSNSSFVIHSLGNFFFNSNNPMSRKGLVADLDFNSNEKVDLNIKYSHYSVCDYKTEIQKQEPNLSKSFNNCTENSSLFRNENLNEYIQYAKNGVKVARKYKRRFFLKNMWRISPRISFYVAFQYILRIYKRLLHKIKCR